MTSGFDDIMKSNMKLLAMAFHKSQHISKLWFDDHIQKCAEM